MQPCPDCSHGRHLLGVFQTESECSEQRRVVAVKPKTSRTLPHPIFYRLPAMHRIAVRNSTRVRLLAASAKVTPPPRFPPSLLSFSHPLLNRPAPHARTQRPSLVCSPSLAFRHVTLPAHCLVIRYYPCSPPRHVTHSRLRGLFHSRGSNFRNIFGQQCRGDRSRIEWVSFYRTSHRSYTFHRCR